ncbi:DUF6675 family protein [Spirochaeta dissipatitropha]
MYLRCVVLSFLILMMSPVLNALDRESDFLASEPEFSLAPWPVDSSLYRMPGDDRITASLEVLYQIPWPENAEPDFQGRVDFLRGYWGEISRLGGLTQPGADGRPVYTEVYRVASPDDLRPLPDFRAEDIQDTMSLYARMIDDVFGETVIHVSINQEERIRVQVRNSTRLRIGPLTVAAPDNMQYTFDIELTEHKITVYAVGTLARFRVPFTRSLIRKNLELRADTVIYWLYEGLAEL